VPGNVAKPAVTAGLVEYSCAQASRPRHSSVELSLVGTRESKRRPSSLRSSSKLREA
jgi:hypothetical protein